MTSNSVIINIPLLLRNFLVLAFIVCAISACGGGDAGGEDASSDPIESEPPTPMEQISALEVGYKTTKSLEKLLPSQNTQNSLIKRLKSKDTYDFFK